MCLKVNNDLHFSKSGLTDNKNKKIEFIDIRNFQLDLDVSLSHKEMEILPKSFKNEIRDVFLRVLDKSEIKKEAEKSRAACVSLKVADGKLVYTLDASKDFKTLRDEKIQKTFLKLSKSIKKYLLDIGYIKEKQIKLSKADKNIIQTSPASVDKVSKEAFRKLKKSDAEWSLWAIWMCEIKNLLTKLCAFLGIKMDFSFIPPGVESILGNLFAFFGVLDGIETETDSKKIEDAEGQKDGKHIILRNVLAMLGSLMDAIAKMFAQGINVLLSIVLSMAISVVFFITSAYTAFKYGYCYSRSKRFKNKFLRYIQNEKLSRQQKMMAALKFLKDKITVTNGQACKILEKTRNQNPSLSDYKIKELVHDAIARKLMTKIRRFERRVGQEVVCRVQEDIDDILKNPANADNIKKAEMILKKVNYENEMIIKENKWYAISAALAAGEIMLLAILVPVFIAALAGFLSSVIVAGLLGEYFYKKHVGKGKVLEKTYLDEKLEYLSDPAKHLFF